MITRLTLALYLDDNCRPGLARGEFAVARAGTVTGLPIGSQPGCADLAYVGSRTHTLGAPQSRSRPICAHATPRRRCRRLR